MRKRKKLQKTELFSIEAQQKADGWLNAAPSLPVLAKPVQSDTNAFKAIVRLHMEDMVLHELTRHVRAAKELPAQIRMNAWSIFELHNSRWHTFPFWYEDKMEMIPVVADARVSPGRVHCIGCDETVIAVRAVR